MRLQCVKMIETSITEITPLSSRSRLNTADVPGPANRRLSFPFDSPDGETERPLANVEKSDIKSIARSEGPLTSSPSGSESSCYSCDGISSATIDPTRNSIGNEQNSTVVHGSRPRNAMTQFEQTNGGNNSLGQILKDRDNRPNEEGFKRWSKDRDKSLKSQDPTFTMKWEGKAAKQVEGRDPAVPTATDLTGNENEESSEMPQNGEAPASSKNRWKKKNKANKVVNANDQNPSTESERSDDSSEKVQESCALQTNPQDREAKGLVSTEDNHHNHEKKRRRRKLDKQKERTVDNDESRNSVDICSETSTSSSVEKDDENISSTPNDLGVNRIASLNMEDGRGHKIVKENRKISPKYHQKDFETKTIGGADSEVIEGSTETKRKYMDFEVMVVRRDPLSTDNSKSDTIDSHFHRDEAADEISRNICQNEPQRVDDEKSEYIKRDSFEGNENLPIRNSVHHTIKKKLMRNENTKEIKLITRRNIEKLLCINDNTPKSHLSSTLA